MKDALLDFKSSYKVQYIEMVFNGDCWIFYKEDSIDYCNLDTKLEEKIKYIADQFEGVCMDKIIIYDNQISFSFEENTCSLVYRRDGTKPKFMNFKSELFSFKVKKISKKWYYCESK